MCEHGNVTVRPEFGLTGSGRAGFSPRRTGSQHIGHEGFGRVNVGLVDLCLVARLHIDLLRVASAGCPRHP